MNKISFKPNLSFDKSFFFSNAKKHQNCDLKKLKFYPLKCIFQLKLLEIFYLQFCNNEAATVPKVFWISRKNWKIGNVARGDGIIYPLQRIQWL